jgi:hypothetical protein
MHIIGLGDYEVTKVEVLEDPVPPLEKKEVFKSIDEEEDED